MRLVKNTSKRVLALLISALMIISMLPISMFTVFASANTALTTDITEKTFFSDQATEFTFTTKAGLEDAGKQVLGSFVLLDESGADAQSAVKTLEYWDVTNGCYREFYGDFGPADTGFPLTDDATSQFRVTFSKAGTYTVKASIINFPDRSVLVSAEDIIITVKPYASELITDIDTKTFVNNTEVEFTYSTVANAQANTMVLGTFSVLDSESNDAQSCIKKLEYWDVTNSCYREFYGDFGPAATGFPLADATSKFRVTFSKAGTYTVNAAIKRFDGGEILCTNTKTITVQTNNAVLTTDINTKTFEINEEVEFAYTTTANDFAGTAVLGTFSLKKDGVDVPQESVKLEYWDVTNSCYREFYGDFGPAATGFPLTDATSNFRVTFKETGTYTVVAQMVTFDGRSVLSENTATIEVKDTKAPVISKVTGNATNWTDSDVTLEVIATDNSGSVAQYRMDSGEWQTSNKFTIKENGKYKFYAKDATGNTSAVSEEIEVKYIDKTAPVIGTITLDPNDWTNESVTVTVPADDVGVGVILYQMDGLKEDKWQTSNEFSIADNEIHKFYVKDSLGNVNTEPTEIKADKYDAKAPVINSVTPDTTEWVADKVVITVDATDEGVKGIAYKLGRDGVWQSANTFDITENGAYQVYVRDALENEIASPKEIVIDNIDKTKPEIVNFVSTTEKWTNNDVTIRGTVNDTQSGVVKLEMKIDEGEWMDLTFDADCNFSRGPISEECDSLYTFRCYDLVGNVSDEYSKRVRIDKTSASVVVNDISDTWKNKQISITGTVSDSASGIKSAVYDNGKGDSGALNIVGADFTFDTNVTGSGEYTYKITVTDNAGNEKTIDTSVVKIDLIDPVVDSASADITTWTNGNVVISGFVSDTSSNVKEVLYRDTNGIEKNAVLEGNNYTITIPKTNYEGNIVVYCYDNAGNRSVDYTVGVKMDIEAPTEPVITYDRNALEVILDVITFGFYNADVTATITTTDNLSLDKIEYVLEGTKAKYDSTVVYDTANLAVEGDLYSGKITVTIPAEFKGTLKARAWDKAGNVSEWADEVSDGREDIKGVVIDTIAPTRTIEFSDARVLDRATMTDVDAYVEGDDIILYYENEAEVTITVNEANFIYNNDGTSDVVVTLTRNGVDSTPDVVWTDESADKHVGKFTISGDGDYFVKVTYTDRSGNEMVVYNSQEIRIDNTDPTTSVEYSSEAEVVNVKYYKADRKAVITIVDHNFLADDVVAVVTALDVQGNKIANADAICAEFATYLKTRSSWTHNGDVHTAEITFDDDAQYTFKIDYKDIVGNTAETYVADPFVVDHASPTNLKIEYSTPVVPLWQDVLQTITFGAYNPKKDVPLIVTISADDITSGVDYFEWFYTREDGASEINKPSGSAEESNILYVSQLLEDADASVSSVSFEIEPEARGYISFRATDYAGNTYGVDTDPETKDKWVEDYERINIVDTIAPTRTIEFSDARVLDRATMTDVDAYVEGDDIILYYENEAEVTITVNEANFIYNNDGTSDVVVTLTRNGVDSTPDVVWTDESADKHVGKFTISGDGDYFVKVTYTDRSGNEMVVYNSQEIRIDNTKPVVEKVEYTPEEANANGKYFNTDRKARIFVREHNFLADDVVASITAKDVTGANVAGYTYANLDDEDAANDFVKEHSEYLADRDNWYYVAADGTLTKDVALAADPDIHVAEVTFTTDAHYTFALDCEDIIGNQAEQYNAPVFVIDHEKPTNLTISYSEPIIPLWKDILNVITFGAYNPKKDVPLIVTISADDITSGVDYFEWFYTREDGASEINKPSGSAEESNILYVSQLLEDADASVSSVSFEIEPEARGYISFRATDYAGNTYIDPETKNKWVEDYERINIVDTIDPIRTVSYTPASQVVDATTLTEVSEYVEGDNVIAYYNTDNTVTLTVNEANFYSEDVVVTLTKNGTDSTPDVVWTDESADKHVGKFIISGDGDYFVKVTYTDRSTNKMKDYTSHLIVIDKTLPDVSVNYATSTEVVLKDTDGNDREYFNDVRKATITIKEHNFRADDVVISVKAKDVLGKNVDVATLTFDKDGNVKEYLAQGATRSEWTAYDVDSVRRADDTYEMTIVYAEDANYTFDIEYTDLATNEAKNYAPDYFTVDKTNPECVEVKYSETVDGKTIIEKILNTITFGAIYYNEQMEVTITAKDDISGINHFVYSYEINDDVSKVNAELLNQTIAEALENSPIVRDKNSSNFTATFNIPKKALTNINQFNGTVYFTAYDRSTNESEQFSGESTIVVDNIKPTSTVTFNDPVQKVDNVSYYDGAINATIVINEANFFSDDVKVVVTKDGANFPVKVDWKDNSVDIHTGTFTLAAPENHSGDGDYIVNVTYVDRSTNEMTPFVSNQLTIDTKDPVINVSDVKHQSANNEETISFTVSVTDTNIALESFKPVLNAVIKKDNGNNSFTYETMSIALGNATTTTNANGETVYTYSVNNLEVDGFYSLVCSAVDYSNHSVSIINSAADEGGNATVETMNFSVNREGSVFWIETEHNDKYTGETLTDKLNGAYANDKVTIKLHEINVDKVDENSGKKTVFTLNDGSESKDIVLEENKNYSKNVIVGTGGWYETIYTLDNGNFDHDGVYSFNVITYDKADNSNVNTKAEAGTISFTLDRTNPVISSNVKTDQSVNDTQFWVEFEITETNLNSETVAVKLTDNSGKAVETKVQDLGNNEYKFLVESGYNYSIEIVAEDLAGNESELYKVEHLTVSTNIFVLWYANTPLFWGSIGGTVLLVGLIILLIFLKKRKKNKEK